MNSLQGVASGPDDPIPTTGGPHDYYFPAGCVCYIKDDADYGELYVAPPGGCPAHSCTCLAAAMGGLHTIDCLHTTLNRPPVEVRRGRPVVDGPAV